MASYKYTSIFPDYIPQGLSKKDCINNSENKIFQIKNSDGRLLTWIPEGEDLKGGLEFGFWVITNWNEQNLYLAITAQEPVVVLDVMDGYREINYDERSRLLRWFIENNLILQKNFGAINVQDYC